MHLFMKLAGVGLLISLLVCKQSYAFESTSDLIRAQAEFLRMVGEARLVWAKARLTEAQAAKEEEKARMLKEFADRLELEMKRLRRDEHAAREKIKRVEYLYKRISSLKLGRTSQTVFLSLRQLFAHFIPTEILIEVMSKNVSAIGDHAFILNKKDEALSIRGFAGGSLGSLFRFIETEDLSLEPWLEAHMEVLKGLSGIDKGVQRVVAEQMTLMEKLRSGTLDIWSVPGDKSNLKPPPGIGPNPSPVPAPPPKNDPGNSQSSPTLSLGGKGHEFCVAARGGYLGCRSFGYSAEDCRVAESGYRDCRAAPGTTHERCLRAHGGFRHCFSESGHEQKCAFALSGYSDCIAVGFSSGSCIGARGGYKDCRAAGLSHTTCIKAEPGFKDCVQDGYPVGECLLAPQGYLFCRTDGNPNRFCMTVQNGFEACRRNSYSAESCASARDGYWDCVTGEFYGEGLTESMGQSADDR